MNTLEIVENVEIGRRLKKALGDVPQKELAAHAGVSPATMSFWTSGKIASPGPVELVRAAAYAGLTPNELFLADVSSRARRPAEGDAEPMSSEETESLGAIVDHLLRLRRLGVPLTATESFLSEFLKAPASGTSESAERPQPAEAIKQAQRLVDSVMTDLPAESVHFVELDSVATRLEKIAATLPSSNPHGSPADRAASVLKVDQGLAPHPSGRKSQKGRNRS